MVEHVWRAMIRDCLSVGEGLVKLDWDGKEGIRRKVVLEFGKAIPPHPRPLSGLQRTCRPLVYPLPTSRGFDRIPWNPAPPGSHAERNDQNLGPK